MARKKITKKEADLMRVAFNAAREHEVKSGLAVAFNVAPHVKFKNKDFLVWLTKKFEVIKYIA